MFERFTDRARRVLVLSQEEARLLNHNFIGTEHLLLGLIREGEGVAAQALEELRVALATVREQVERIVGRGQGSAGRSPPFTPRAKKVLELSLREAVQLGHDYIGTEHLLLGLVREGEGVAPQVLSGMGVDVGAVRQAVIGLLSDTGVKPLRAVAPDAVEPAVTVVSPVTLLGPLDLPSALSAPLSSTAPSVESLDVNGLAWQRCTYRPSALPEVSIAVAAASVPRTAFDDWTAQLPDAEEVPGLGDAATFSARTRSLRVLSGSTLFVVVVGSHPEARAVAEAAARLALTNLAGTAPPPPGASA